MKKNLTRLFILGILACPIIGMAVACSEEEDCSMTTRAMLYCNLYTIDEESNTVKKDTLKSLTITAWGTDSVILNRGSNVKDLTLPLRYTADSTVLVFHYDEGRDTLIIRQTNTPYFVSMDCGYQMQQEVRSVSYTRHLLDSIYISEAEANIYGTENLKLFY
ncbi:MAG: calcium-binding protein P [Bacteroides sp.]|nr:calcium-binding protein P [Bacteroides sp.]